MSKKMDRTESYWTRQLVQYVKDNHPTFLHLKFADHFTHGVPDDVIIGDELTLWLELKVLKPNQGIVDRIYQDELQLYTMNKIEELVGGAWYFIFLPGFNMSYVAVRPSEIIADRKKTKSLSQLLPMHHSFAWITQYFTGETA